MITGAGGESIFVKLQLITKGFVKGMNNANTSMQRLNKNVNKQAHGFSNLTKTQRITRANTDMTRISQQGFMQTMRMGVGDFKKFNEQGRKFSTFGGRVANSFRKSTHGLRGFRMEMLGVMFFGMMLNRAFAGLMKTSKEWLGVNELLTLALGILFLPVAEILLEWVMKFLYWVTNLTEAQKLWIGKMVLLGAIIGGMIFLIGTFALGIGSLILVFKGLLAPIGLVIAALIGFGLLKTLKGDMKDFGDGTEIMAQGINLNFSKIPGFLKGLINKISSWLSENKEKIFNKGVEIFESILNGLHENKEEIGQFLEDLIKKIGAWIGENAEKFIEIGVTIGKHILTGMFRAAWDIGEGIGEAYLNFLEKFRTSTVGKLMFGGGFTGTGGIPNFQEGGIMPHTGLAHLHAGERITPAKKAGEAIVLNVTYNVNVSDKSEFEVMLNENNMKLTEDVRRLIKV